MLVILGVFLPWGCYQDFFGFCVAGINFNLANLAYGNSDAIIMMVMISIGGSLIIGAIDSIYPWRWEIISIFVASVISYFSINKGMAYDNGGLVIIFLSCISLWGVFRLARLTQRANVVVTVSSSALVLTLAYHMIRILIYQIPRLEVQLGLPIAFVGSMLMFVMRKSINSPSTS